MPKKNTDTASNQQMTSFIEAARALECDESEERFNEALGKIARHKPKLEAPPTKDGVLESMASTKKRGN